MELNQSEVERMESMNFLLTFHWKDIQHEYLVKNDGSGNKFSYFALHC